MKISPSKNFKRNKPNQSTSSLQWVGNVSYLGFGPQNGMPVDLLFFLGTCTNGLNNRQTGRCNHIHQVKTWLGF
jgi:hypothetical protein